MTTKGLRHIQIRENAVRESCINGFIEVKHISGKVNLSDMFTKEDKYVNHFIMIRDYVLEDQFPILPVTIPTGKSPLVTSHNTNGGCYLGNWDHR